MPARLSQRAPELLVFPVHAGDFANELFLRANDPFAMTPSVGRAAPEAEVAAHAVAGRVQLGS
jgi:hypothetical protein